MSNTVIKKSNMHYVNVKLIALHPLIYLDTPMMLFLMLLVMFQYIQHKLKELLN